MRNRRMSRMRGASQGRPHGEVLRGWSGIQCKRGGVVSSDCLSQKLFGIEFKNPVLAASGTFGYGEDFSHFF